MTLDPDWIPHWDSRYVRSGAGSDTIGSVFDRPEQYVVPDEELESRAKQFFESFPEFVKPVFRDVASRQPYRSLADGLLETEEYLQALRPDLDRSTGMPSGDPQDYSFTIDESDRVDTSGDADDFKEQRR